VFWKVPGPAAVRPAAGGIHPGGASELDLGAGPGAVVHQDAVLRDLGAADHRGGAGDSRQQRQVRWDGGSATARMGHSVATGAAAEGPMVARCAGRLPAGARPAARSVEASLLGHGASWALPRQDARGGREFGPRGYRSSPFQSWERLIYGPEPWAPVQKERGRPLGLQPSPRTRGARASSSRERSAQFFSPQVLSAPQAWPLAFSPPRASWPLAFFPPQASSPLRVQP